MDTSDRYCPACGAANSSIAASCFACGRSLKITVPLSQNASNYPLLQERYRTLAQLGTGGSSAVYKAEDILSNDHLVAIKAISLRGLKPQEVIDLTGAFNREVLLLSGLKHPSVPHIYQSFSEREGWYVVMDFIEGTTLEKYLENMQGERLQIGEVLDIALQLCAVLDYLHTSQPPVIFRDLKPANIMLKPDSRIALIDFGIARHFKPGKAKDTTPLGTPGYAAPEQYGSKQTTPRTDIYSFGVILHQLLTGDDPALAPFCFAPLHLEDQPVLARLETLVMQMVEIDADKRPESISVIKEELQHIAREWSTHRQGLKARGPYSNPPPPAFWRVLLPPSEETGVPLASGSGGQMSLLQLPVTGRGSSSASSSAYWSTPRPPKRYNGMAIASFIFAVLGMLAILSLFLASGFLLHHHTFWVLIPVLLPSILAVICGHIGKRRAKKVHGLGESYDMAVVGLVLGWLFGGLYLAIVLSTLLLSFLHLLVVAV